MAGGRKLHEASRDFLSAGEGERRLKVVPALIVTQAEANFVNHLVSISQEVRTKKGKMNERKDREERVRGNQDERNSLLLT